MLRASALILAFCAAALPLAAHAGAWKQPVDAGFSATSFVLRNTDLGLVSEFGYYRDFGISKHFDLGIDLNQQGYQSGHALIFARLPLRQGPDKTQIAAELALGANHTAMLWHPMYRLTLSAGRSTSTKHGNLWGNLDLSYEQTGDRPHPLWKLNGSFGLDTQRRVKPLLQLETSYGQGADFSYTVTPSIRISLAGLSLGWARDRSRKGAPRKSKTGQQSFENSELTIGLEYRRANTQSLGLKIALWHRF